MSKVVEHPRSSSLIFLSEEPILLVNGCKNKLVGALWTVLTSSLVSLSSYGPLLPLLRCLLEQTLGLLSLWDVWLLSLLHSPVLMIGCWTNLVFFSSLDVSWSWLVKVVLVAVSSSILWPLRTAPLPRGTGSSACLPLKPKANCRIRIFCLSTPRSSCFHQAAFAPRTPLLHLFSSLSWRPSCHIRWKNVISEKYFSSIGIS